MITKTRKNIKNNKRNKKHLARKKSKQMSSKTIQPNYTQHLSEPWFSLISLGLKTVEGRKNKGVFKEMQPGNIIEWYNDDFLPRKILTKVIRKTTYHTFKDYLEKERLDKCLPGIPTLEHGLSVYYKYFTKEDEANYGVIAIEIQRI